MSRPIGSAYLLGDRLGSGAMGTVWRGTVRATSETVAIKLLRESLLHDPELVVRFLRERSVLLKLRHPHIVGLRDMVAEGEMLALVMDLVDGPTLRRYLDARTTVAPGHAADLVSGLADALAAAHTIGVVHRDIKPANILLSGVAGERAGDPGTDSSAPDQATCLEPLTAVAGTLPDPAPDGGQHPTAAAGTATVLTGQPTVTLGTGTTAADLELPGTLAVPVHPTGTPAAAERPRALLADFGIARLVQAAGTQLTKTHAFLGTPGYLAPETAIGGRACPASDVYAIGIVLYELITGRPPFQAENPFAVLRAHVEEAVSQPATMPDAFWAVLEPCLRKEPERRPDAAYLAEQLRELAEWRQDLLTVAVPGSAPETGSEERDSTVAGPPSPVPLATEATAMVDYPDATATELVDRVPSSTGPGTRRLDASDPAETALVNRTADTGPTADQTALVERPDPTRAFEQPDATRQLQPRPTFDQQDRSAAGVGATELADRPEPTRAFEQAEPTRQLGTPARPAEREAPPAEPEPKPQPKRPGTVYRAGQVAPPRRRPRLIDPGPLPAAPPPAAGPGGYPGGYQAPPSYPASQPQYGHGQPSYPPQPYPAYPPQPPTHQYPPPAAPHPGQSKGRKRGQAVPSAPAVGRPARRPGPVRRFFRAVGRLIRWTFRLALLALLLWLGFVVLTHFDDVARLFGRLTHF